MKPSTFSTTGKLPPFGKTLAERQRFKNPPDFVFVYCGVRAWDEAKAMQRRSDVAAMVLPPDISPHSLAWPVTGCLCIVSWNIGPAEQTIIDLIKVLLRSGAEIVTVWPRWVDYTLPSVTYDDTRPVGDRWVPLRESIRTYRLQGGGRAA